MKTTDTGSYDNAYTVAVNIFLVFDSGVFDSLTSSNEGILSVKVELTEFLAVDMIGAVEVLHFASKLSLEK
jgi:hypothetical protein